MRKINPLETLPIPAWSYDGRVVPIDGTFAIVKAGEGSDENDYTVVHDSSSTEDSDEPESIKILHEDEDHIDADCSCICQQPYEVTQRVELGVRVRNEHVQIEYLLENLDDELGEDYLEADGNAPSIEDHTELTHTL